ncbi:MAG: hypothetical protein CSA58_08685 [Micrococcales bacterium]|nr:MAG: hypothetical protein CSB46_04525 [Micrococcales bacterium]PIE26560.1 MAG: hypothetical protein CSA58_08685 [Micrococcales bacterium]
MLTPETSAAGPQDIAPLVRVGRQGIFTADGRLVGHELLFRGLSSDKAGDAAPDLRGQIEDQATSHVISATFGDFGVEELGGGLPLYINMTRGFLVGQLPLPFGPQNVVLEVLENIAVDEQLVDSLAQLKDEGYVIAIDDFTGEPHRIPLLAFADVVKLDLLCDQLDVDSLVDTVQAYAPKAQILAERVEDEATVQRCIDAGIELFQGYYFERPSVLETVRLSPSQLVCLRLMHTLADPHTSMREIESVVALDPGLSLRVLRTANSASSGLQRKVVSLRQAVVLLGPTMLSAWVALTLLGGVGGGRREDLVTILTRARACETVSGRCALDPSTAYTAGMVSAVAQVLRTDVAALVNRAGVGEDLAEALIHGSGRYGDLLTVLLNHEMGVGEATDFPMTPLELSQAYLRAWAWAQSMVASMFD